MSPTKQARRDSGKLKSNFCQIQHFELLEVFCPLTTNGLLVVIFNSPLFPHPKECWEILALLNIAAMTVIRVTKNMCAFSLSFWMKGFFFLPSRFRGELSGWWDGSCSGSPMTFVFTQTEKWKCVCYADAFYRWPVWVICTRYHHQVVRIVM